MKSASKTRGRLLALAVATTALLYGCGDSRDNFVFTNSNISAAPVAADDSFPALGNATLNQSAANGVLANDASNGASISAFDTTGSQGGTLTLNPDGSFVYTPALNFVGTETFNYTLSNILGDSTATLTLTSTGLGRFVDNTLTNGTGTQTSPFNNLADAVAAAQNGDTIFVARGDGSNNGMTGGFILPTGVDLIGEGSGLILTQTVVPQGLAPTIQGPITCSGDNTVSGFRIDGGTGALIRANNASDLTIADNTLVNPATGEDQLTLLNVSGTTTVRNNTFDLPSEFGSYAAFINNNTNATVIFTDNVFQNTQDTLKDDAVIVGSEGSSVLALTFSNNQFNGSQTAPFGRGLNVQEVVPSSLTATVQGNSGSQFVNAALEFGGVSGTCSLNTFSQTSGGPAIFANLRDGSFTFDQNTLSNNLLGMGLTFDLGTATAVLSSNNISSSTQDGVLVSSSGNNSGAKLALRNNTLGGGTAGASRILWPHSNDLCVELVGNTFDGNALFDGSSTGLINIERRDTLGNINTFTTGSPMFQGSTAEVAQGFCNIP